MSPIPVVVCGASEAIARGVVTGLQPEYEVIYVCLSAAEGAEVIPRLLQGLAPLADGENVGTKNFSNPPAAIVTGGAYDAESVEGMRKACGESNVPWLRVDNTKPAPPIGPEYGKAIVQRTKECLTKLKEEGRMETNEIYFF